MSIKTIEINNTINSVNLNKKTYYETQGPILNKEMDFLSEYKESLKELTFLEKKFSFICNTIGIDFSKNSLYTLMTELTKLIPFIQKNYHLLLIGEGATGKSSPFSLIFNKPKVFPGIPTTAVLRGSEKEKEITPLLSNTLILLEEISNINSNINSIPLLKVYLESNKFLKYNKIETNSDCSIVATSNDYSEITNYKDLKNIFQNLPPNIKDEAFMSRFNGILPHYKNLFSEKIYSTSGKGWHCLEFQEVLLALRELPNLHYTIENYDNTFSPRDITNISSTINGFVKIFYANEKPDSDFLNFVTQWSKYINSLNNNNNNKTIYPFNKNSISFISKNFFRDVSIEYLLFLDKSRILFKYKDPKEYNSIIFALDGFGILKNNFDLIYYNENSNCDYLNSFKKIDLFRLSLDLKGNIISNKKFSSDGVKIPNVIQDNEFNELLLKLLEYSKKNCNSNFRGLPDFQKSIILNQARLIFNVSINSIDETSFSLENDSFYFLNFSKILNEK